MLNKSARQQLQKKLPLDMLATKSWLEAQGLSRHFLDNALRNHTLISLASGVYARQESRLHWKGIVVSLQRMSEIPVHVGGLTALELEGLAHYLPMGNLRVVQLYSEVRLPRWLARLESVAIFQWNGTRRLWSDELMQNTDYLRQERWREDRPTLYYSCPEKAIIEVLDAVPKMISFEHADQLIQGLYNLSPHKLHYLLKHCRSIKVKRLFLWLAERHQHVWFSRLSPDQYALGNGKRVIAQEGRLEQTWQITVPRDM